VRFLAVAEPGAEPVVSDESLDVRWWDADALPDPELAELVALSLARWGEPSERGGGNRGSSGVLPSP
jgi:hypothetical protein